LIFRTEIDSLPSNLARIWACFVSTAWYQETCIRMSKGFMNATASLEKATDWSGAHQKSELIQGNQAILVSCNRYKARPSSCQIWTHVVHPVREKKETQNIFQGTRGSVEVGRM
jgi:hypothetical protein